MVPDKRSSLLGFAYPLGAVCIALLFLLFSYIFFMLMMFISFAAAKVLLETSKLFFIQKRCGVYQ